jgi:hypothetical protein
MDGHEAGFGGMFGYGEVDAAFLFRRRALDDALVDLFNGAFFEDLREVFMGGFVFGEDDDAAGVAVEAVDGEDVAVFFSQQAFEGGIFSLRGQGC